MFILLNKKKQQTNKQNVLNSKSKHEIELKNYDKQKKKLRRKYLSKGMKMKLELSNSNQL